MFDADAPPPVRKRPTWLCWQCFSAAAMVLWLVAMAVYAWDTGFVPLFLSYGAVALALVILPLLAGRALKKMQDEGH